MKKLLVALLTLSLLLGSFLSLAVSADTSPVKDYKTAAYGELLYTVNFNGDSAFTPTRRGPDDHMKYEVSSDGLSLTISIKAGGETNKRNYFGGIVKGLLTDSVNTTYTMKYMVNASANPIKNNSIGVGGLILIEGNADTDPYFYNNYSNHGQAGADSRSSISISKQKQGEYVMWNTLAKAPKLTTDGFATMINVFDLSRDKMVSYYLATDDTWLKLEELSYNLFDTDEDIEADYGLGFMSYAYYDTVNSTVKNVEFYKGDIVTNTLPEGAPADTGNTGGDTGNTGGDAGDNNTGNTDNTDTTTTKAPETTTKAPETTAAAEKKGCGSSIGFAGLALVATVATVGVAKKRKND